MRFNSTYYDLFYSKYQPACKDFNIQFHNIQKATILGFTD